MLFRNWYHGRLRQRKLITAQGRDWLVHVGNAAQTSLLTFVFFSLSRNLWHLFDLICPAALLCYHRQLFGSRLACALHALLVLYQIPCSIYRLLFFPYFLHPPSSTRGWISILHLFAHFPFWIGSWSVLMGISGQKGDLERSWKTGPNRRSLVAFGSRWEDTSEEVRRPNLGG